MLSYILKRLVQGVVVILFVVFIIFIIIRVIPGDPARLIAAGGATPESIEKIRHELEMDKPLITQFLGYLSKIIKGDLGNSIFRSKGGSTHHGVHQFITETERTSAAKDAVDYEKAEVLGLILERFPLTLLLTGMAILFAMLIAGPLGILSAIKPGTIWGTIATYTTVVTQSLPNFWMGIVLILILAVKLKLLPAMGYKNFSYVILPAFTLSLSLVPVWLRVIRLGLTDVLASLFVKGLKSRGISKARILFKHALRNTLVSFVTVLSVHLGYLIGGAIIIEFVFDYPGLGLLTIVAVLQRDFTVVQGIVVFFATIFVLINIFIDIIYIYIDPRITLE